MPKQARDPLTVNETDTQRAASWLRRHGGPVPPSPLVTARLAARHANRQWEVLLYAGCGVAIIGWALLAEIIPYPLAGSALRGPVELSVFYVLLAGVAWWVARLLRRTEARIAAALPRRVTRTRRPSAAQVLGRWYLFAAFAVYPGGVVVGIAVAVSAGGTKAALGTVMAAGTALLGLIAVAVMAEAVRRPALADDADALAVDDLLRTEDAHRAAPFPLAMAGFAAAGSPGGVATWLLVGYAVGGLALWLPAMLVDGRAAVASSEAAQGAAR